MHNFKKALTTTILFFLALAIFSLAFLQIYFGGENYYYQDVRERKALAGTIDTLIVGASHAHRGVNPEILDDVLGCNSYNISGSNMSLEGQYAMIEKEISRNPVKTVFVEVSYETVRLTREKKGPEGDLYTLPRMDNLPERLGYFFQHIRPSEYAQSYYFYLSNAVDCLKWFCQGKYTTVNTTEGFYKGYAPYGGEPHDQTTDYAALYKTSTHKAKIRQENVQELKDIIALCQSQDIRVILFTTPVSTARICERVGMDRIRECYEELAGECGVEYYDFNLLKNRDELFSDACDFEDDQHLWTSGVETFTTCMAELIRSVDDGEDVSDRFFASYDAYEQTQSYYPSDT